MPASPQARVHTAGPVQIPTKALNRVVFQPRIQQLQLPSNRGCSLCEHREASSNDKCASPSLSGLCSSYLMAPFDFHFISFQLPFVKRGHKQPSDNFTDKKPEQLERENREGERKPHVKAKEQTLWRLMPGQAFLGCAPATDVSSSQPGCASVHHTAIM